MYTELYIHPEGTQQKGPERQYCEVETTQWGWEMHLETKKDNEMVEKLEQ